MWDTGRLRCTRAIRGVVGGMAYLLAVVAIFGLTACSELLPRSEAVTETPWSSYEDAQKTFDQIVLNKSTSNDLRRMKLDPALDSNVTILSHGDVLRRFMPVSPFEPSTLDPGVRECLKVTIRCKGYEVNHKVLKRTRVGNFWADIFNFKRRTQIVGWRFSGVVLVAGDVVVYKLTGGQPTIHEFEQSNNPLGPLQGVGERVLQ